MPSYSQAYPHSDIKQIFENIFFVTGTNITEYNNVILQHSRNMVIIREKDDLSLINTVRLNDAGLKKLSALGRVKNIIRIGSFHGRDDAFYLDNYEAKLWELPAMQSENGRKADFTLTSGGVMPISNCKVINFETSKFPEAILHINQNGGILISCDSIKNWLKADEFFNNSTAQSYAAQNFFGHATISEIWKQATQIEKSELLALKELDFCHLLSAHGEPLLNDARIHVINTLAAL